MKAIEQYFHVVLFIMLYKVCDHWNESYWAVLSCGTVYYAVQGGSDFQVCVCDPSVWPFKWKLLSSTRYNIRFLKLSLSDNHDRFKSLLARPLLLNAFTSNLIRNGWCLPTLLECFEMFSFSVMQSTLRLTYLKVITVPATSLVHNLWVTQH